MRLADGCRCALAALIALCAGCGGQSKAAVVPNVTVAPAIASKRATIAIRVIIPPSNRSGSAKRRSPRYVSRSTQGLGVSYRASAVGAATATAFPAATTPVATLDVSAQSSLCAGQLDGSRICSLTFTAPAGVDDFEITAWDALAVSGSFAAAGQLSTATLLNQSINAGQTTTLGFTLDGIVNAIALALTPSALTASDTGSTQTVTLAVNAEDVDGNVILGSGEFIDANGNAVTIAINQAAVAPGSALRTTFAQTSITPQASSAAITYLGGATSGTLFTAGTNVTLPGSLVAATLAIRPRATITEFGLTAGTDPTGITTGPDGNLWFAESGSGGGAGILASISRSGTILQDVAFGGSAQSIGSVATGPDGNLWLTIDDQARIDRITPGGAITQFTAGISGDPYSITAGPDGNLWFTEDFAHTVGRITPTGTVTEFHAGITVGAFPYAITTGPDGNLWFTEAGLSQIGRITPAGVVTEFAQNITANAFPFGIATGPAAESGFARMLSRKSAESIRPRER